MPAAAILLTGLFCAVCSAAPSLQINKGPVQPIPSWTGPTNDMDAVSGQWFTRLDNMSNIWRTHEFYDNVNPDFGGGYLSHMAIYGRTANIIYNGDKIIGFDIIATISNDVPALSAWLDGTNSHGEFLVTASQHELVLYGAILCTEFAVSGLDNLQNPWHAPYVDRQLYIIATNEDRLAWFCWTPENEPHKNPDGAYFVPGWNFGDIAPGSGVTRRLSFTIDAPGIGPGDGDPRYQSIIDSSIGIDILANRTTSLKISDWIDELPNDIPTLVGPYPEYPFKGSNCSVFHNIPEPAILPILFLLLLLPRKTPGSP
jgi:hypothetical protein